MTGAIIGSTMENIILGKEDVYMGGVVAGSTMQEVAVSRKKWGALMINTGCNLDCPRCYLGEKKGNMTMLSKTAQKLVSYAQKNWEGVVIIGTEPLFDEQSVKVINIFSSAIRTHLITNGTNLEQFADDIKQVKRIDISLDGGPKTYCRSASFQRILAGAKKWKKLSEGELYVLHVLSQENCGRENIADMLSAGLLFEAEKTIFSPYIQTIGGRSVLTTISTREIAKSLRDFSEEKWTLIIDPYHALLERREWKKIKKEVSCLPKGNVLIAEFDPGEKIMRVDIKGNIHHPFLALHPGIKLRGLKII